MMRSSNCDECQCLMEIVQYRVETEEQQGVSQTVSDPEEDSTHKWLEDDEAEYQSPEDDGELSFEDAEAAGATPGTVRVSHTLGHRSSQDTCTSVWHRLRHGRMPRKHSSASPSGLSNCMLIYQA